MKLNKKGFMMAEVIVVSAVVVVTLTSLYISYNKIFSAYKTRINYEDTNLLYALSYYRDILVEETDTAKSGNYNKLMEAIYDIANTDKSHVFPTYNNYLTWRTINSLDNVYLVSIGNNNKIDGSDFAEKKMEDYINYLNTSVDFSNSSYIMLMERCVPNKECKYAYIDLDDNVCRGRNYKIGDNYYCTLADAFEAIRNVVNREIIVLRDTIEYSEATCFSGYNAVLNLNGHTIDMNNNYLNNEGNLEITNVASETGKIIGKNVNSEEGIIKNTGTLKIHGVDGVVVQIINTDTSNSYNKRVIYNAGNMDLGEDVVINFSELPDSSCGENYRYIIGNDGALSINGATIGEAREGSYCNKPQMCDAGIISASDKSVTLIRGTISTCGYGISDPGNKFNRTGGELICFVSPAKDNECISSE